MKTTKKPHPGPTIIAVIPIPQHVYNDPVAYTQFQHDVCEICNPNGYEAARARYLLELRIREPDRFNDWKESTEEQ